jgi:hypothetical protein
MSVATKPKSVDEIRAELEVIRAKRKAERKDGERVLPTKKDWYGLVYCDVSGGASIADFDGGGIWLGKAAEIIPYLKMRGINGENLDSVLLAVEEFREEQKNQEFSAKAKNEKPRVSKTQSCHLATENQKTPITIPPQKTHRATFEDNAQNLASQHPFFKRDPKLFALLESLTKRDIGIPTIHREINEAGYNIPYRTVGRWVSQMRSKELL